MRKESSGSKKNILQGAREKEENPDAPVPSLSPRALKPDGAAYLPDYLLLLGSMTSRA